MEVKNTFEMNKNELAEYNHQKLMEFKELFLTTDLPVDEIFNKINVSKGDITYRYIQGQRKAEGISAKNREVTYNVIEQSTEERYVELEEFYQEFKEIWLANPKISKKKVYEQLGKTQQKERVKYVNQRMNEDNLPEHFPNRKGGRQPKKKWERNAKNMKTNLIHDKTPEETYQEYKDLFYNSDLSIKEIYEKIGVPQNQNTHYTYIREQAEKDGLNGYRRRLQLKHGGRPKGSKNIKGLTGKEKEEHDQYFEEGYQEFLKYYQDLNLSVQDILKKMGTHHKSNMYFYFRRRIEEDGLDIRKRQGKVIGSKVKKTYAERHKENEPYYEERYHEYKKLFFETSLSMKEIYNKLNVEPRSVCAKHIRKRAKEDGLNAHKRRFKIHPHHKVSEEEQKIREELYMEYKKLFLETDMNIGDMYKQLGISSSSSRRAKYIRERAIEEGLNGRTRMNKLRRKHSLISPEEGEPLFEKYKKLFNTTDYKLSKIYEIINVKDKSPEFNYIRKRCIEEGLDGRKRMFNIKKQKTSKQGRKKYKSNSSKGKARKKKYSDKTIKQVEDSKEILNRVFKQRNVQETTQKGYIACIFHWFNFMGDKFDNLQENIDYYIHEEDERLPMRERTIKKDLLGFREYLINCNSMHTKKSIMSYYSKITAIFRHVALEIPTLPQVKLEKGYVSNYNDLPTHEMIRIACDQSPDVLKSIFLFMSSSGSAKAETLSITIKMFIEGCSEYLSEIPTSQNIKECLEELKDRHDIVPLIYLRRIKTDKWYYTCCSPEASYMIIKYLNGCSDLKWEDKLFPFSSSLLLYRFQKVNDNNDWGKVGGYRRFRAHALRKFMASNIGLPRDQVDSFQGRSKDMIAEAYFKQDPKQLKKIYLSAMHRVMIYNNWGYDMPLETIEKSQIETNITVPEKPMQEEVHVKADDNSSNLADELMKYGQLQKEGFLTMEEFNTIKSKLFGGLLDE